MEDGLAADEDEVMSTTSQTSVDTRSGDGTYELLFTSFSRASLRIVLQRLLTCLN